LVAIIAAIALTMRRRADTKYQRPAEQVLVKKEDRLRVVSVNSEDNQDIAGLKTSGSAAGADASGNNGSATNPGAQS